MYCPCLSDFDDKYPLHIEYPNNELLIKSIEVVRKTNKTSISHFQRKLKIGFSLACEIKNELEKLGIIEDVNKRITFENLKH